MFTRCTEAILAPDLVQLEPGLVMAAFRLMKLIPAKHVVDKAIADGRVDRAVGVAETSSGTYALGMGMAAAEHGIPFHIFSDPVIDPPLKRRLEDLGGTVHIVAKDPGRSASVQTLRLEALRAHLDANPGAFWTQQYDNPENQEAYYPFADQLLDAVGDRFTLVGTVGSGGSTCGTAKRLRARGADVELVGVDTFGSVLFGLPNGARALRGLGNGLLPKNLQHDCFDEVHWVTAADAFAWTRRLHQRHSAFLGPTSGAAFQVARSVHARDPGRVVVFIGADDGSRYLDSVYDDAALRATGDFTADPTAAPRTVEDLRDATGGWCRFAWGRRTLQEAAR